MPARKPKAEAPGAQPRPFVDGTRFSVGGEELAVLRISQAAPPCLDALTRTEQEVCRLLLQGLTNADIAKARGTSTHTVYNQVASIFRKLGVHSRSELAAHWG